MTKKRITDTARYRTRQKLNSPAPSLLDRVVTGVALSATLIAGGYHSIKYAQTHPIEKNRANLYATWPHDTFTVIIQDGLEYCALSQRQYGPNARKYLEFVQAIPYNKRAHRWQTRSDSTGSVVDSIRLPAIMGRFVDAGTQIILPHNPKYPLDCAVATQDYK